MRVLAVSGSLRRDSHNTMLLRAAEELAPEGVEFEFYDELEFVPPYNEDRDGDEAPLGAVQLRARIADADALLIATPEYNSSVPGQLKNAVDWASRPVEAGGRDRSQHGHVRRRLGAGRAPQDSRDCRRTGRRRRGRRQPCRRAVRCGRAARGRGDSKRAPCCARHARSRSRATARCCIEKRKGGRKRPPLSGDQRWISRGASCLGPRDVSRAARNASSPTLARRFPVGAGDTPLPAGTSTARTGNLHSRTTSFPRLAQM